MKREPINISTYLKSSEHRKHQSEETVDRVSLYLTPLAFGTPTVGNVPCSNTTTSTPEEEHEAATEKQEMFHEW
ncbi:hypothetical protein T01_7595 [Trichinella spiralis]|uniref:Uncharacterized protein n=1 Tax=Trichinella spiralis TaxID=6334 RepID=A0A0V1BFS3_TRISP|nr:hypothetical protein T01_7595 [Trichinella spiralis]